MKLYCNHSKNITLNGNYTTTAAEKTNECLNRQAIVSNSIAKLIKPFNRKNLSLHCWVIATIKRGSNKCENYGRIESIQLFGEFSAAVLRWWWHAVLSGRSAHRAAHRHRSVPFSSTGRVFQIDCTILGPFPHWVLTASFPNRLTLSCTPSFFLSFPLFFLHPLTVLLYLSICLHRQISHCRVLLLPGVFLICFS